MRLSLFFVLIFINDPSSLCSCLWRVVVIFAFGISIVVSSRLRSVSLWRALPSRLLNNSIIGVVIVCYLFLLIRTRKEIILFIVLILLCAEPPPAKVLVLAVDRVPPLPWLTRRGARFAWSPTAQLLVFKHARVESTTS